MSTLYLLITFIGTFFNSSSVENEVRSRTYILDALSSNFTAYKPHTTSYIMHAAMLPCASMTRGRHLVSKVFIYANLHKLLCDINGRHYNVRNSDVSLPHPLWVRGRRRLTFQTTIWVQSTGVLCEFWSLVILLGLFIECDYCSIYEWDF